MSTSTPSIEAPASLWRNPSFVRLWFAQTVSNAGSQITAIALPLTAVLVLGATPFQMGFLGIAGRAPNLLFDLFAGVWVDRTRRRPILVGADLGRALLLGTIPIAAMLGYLTFAQLYFVTFVVGTLTAFFSLASISILPSLVKGEQLVEANSKLAITDSVLTIAAPSAAGGLVQLLGAPKAIIADALSYVLSALSLKGIVAPEQPPSRAQRRSVWAEIGEGIRELVRTPLLRALAVSVSVGTFGLAVQETVLVLFLTRELGFTPAMIGLLYACGGGGALVGAILSRRVARRVGIGRAIVLGDLLWALGVLVIPIADANIVLIGAGQVVAQIGSTIWSVNQMSLRQSITPVGLFARATAARRFLMISLQITGAALGGFLGSTVGLRATMVVGAIGLIAGFLLVCFSPVRAVSITGRTA
jgi:predicted MFS family arabinose efflux permease